MYRNSIFSFVLTMKIQENSLKSSKIPGIFSTGLAAQTAQRADIPFHQKPLNAGLVI
jgi:hypothetical protein